MATHSSILAWRLPWTEEPGGLQSTGHKEQLHFHFQVPPYMDLKLLSLFSASIYAFAVQVWRGHTIKNIILFVQLFVQILAQILHYYKYHYYKALLTLANN